MSKNKSNNKKPSQPKQAKVKYDWPALKQEYFESDCIEVKAFFMQKYGKFNSAMMHATVGWPNEKKNWRFAEVQLRLQNLQLNRIEGLKETLDDVIVLCRMKIEWMKKTGRINVKELYRIWEMLRTENMLPKAYTHNVNENSNIDLGVARTSLLEKVDKNFTDK